MFQSLQLVPERPFADIVDGKIIVLNFNCSGMIIGNHKSALFIGSCSVDVLIGRRIGTVKHKIILQLFNVFYPMCFSFDKVPLSDIITVVI